MLVKIKTENEKKLDQTIKVEKQMIKIKDNIEKMFEEANLNTEEFRTDDYMKLDERDWRKFYKTTYEILIEKYLKHKKILQLKRKLSFEELCEFYNTMIEEHKMIIKNTSLDDPQSLNRRTSFYHIILDCHMDEVFEFKHTDKNRKESLNND